MFPAHRRVASPLNFSNVLVVTVPAFIVIAVTSMETCVNKTELAEPIVIAPKILPVKVTLQFVPIVTFLWLPVIVMVVLLGTVTLDNPLVDVVLYCMTGKVTDAGAYTIVGMV